MIFMKRINTPDNLIQSEALQKLGLYFIARQDHWFLNETFIRVQHHFGDSDSVERLFALKSKLLFDECNNGLKNIRNG